MTEENKGLKVVFAPGCFDSFEGTQEELDQMVNEIQDLFANKTGEEIQNMSRPVDITELVEDETISDDEFERILYTLVEAGKPRNLQ